MKMSQALPELATFKKMYNSRFKLPNDDGVV